MMLMHTPTRRAITRLIAALAFASLTPPALAEAPVTESIPVPSPSIPSTASQSPETAPESVVVDLAPLLSGVEDQCRYSLPLERFWRALANPSTAVQALGAKLATAIGTIEVADEIDYLMYTIPVRGHWRQVPVKQIQFGLGKGNGIHVLLVEFDVPAAEAQRVFQPLVDQSKLAMARDPENTLDATTDLLIDNGRARLVCDLST